MNVTTLRSDKIYQKIMEAPMEKKNDIYRYELMKPFKGKWDCYHIPLKAEKEGGYDIIMASHMLGVREPEKIGEQDRAEIELMASDTMWKECTDSICRSLHTFVEAGIELPVQEYLYTIMLADPESPYTALSDGYCGDGGIPGYIMGWMMPNETTMKRLPVALAHEVAHNVRFQFIRWSDKITLEEMMVNEGLAENFATWMYGEENAGPWVTKTDVEELNDYIKPIIYEGRKVQGLENLNAYLYGDEIANMQHFEPVGLPFCAGYACGYYMIQYFLKKTGISIVEATKLPYETILSEVEDYWNENS